MLASEVVVDDEGILLGDPGREVVIDALFDGRRIWSFWLPRDAERRGSGFHVAWPETLRDFLNGWTELTLAEHGSEEAIFADEVHLGAGEDRIAVATKQGKPLSLDKYLRRVQSFDTRSAEHVGPLLDAIDDVLEALRRVGVDAFLAYGTLLGAVRDGRLIGHDSDADLGYVSVHEHPADVMLESFRIQRRLAEEGYPITRYSGAAFKVDVQESDGTVRGLDVFGGFMREGHLHLMGEIRTPFQRDWVFPLGTTTLEGREYPAPANPDRLLAATYGDSWRTPDPAFHFATPSSTYRRLNGWFRGIRVGRPTWDRLYAAPGKPRGKASPFAQWVSDRERAPGAFVDIGCGRGRDVALMARRGVPSLGVDVHPRAFRAQARALDAELGSANPASFWTCNLYELRHVAVTGARIARMPGDRVVVARHVVDVLARAGRDQLWLLAKMALKDGDAADGRLYLEFLCREGRDGYAQERYLEVRSPRKIRTELEAHGAEVVEQEVLPVGSGPDSSRVCRIVAQWSR